MKEIFPCFRWINLQNKIATFQSIQDRNRRSGRVHGLIEMCWIKPLAASLSFLDICLYKLDREPVLFFIHHSLERTSI